MWKKKIIWMFGWEGKIPPVMFGNSFHFLFSKTCFWEYKEKKNIFLVFFK